MRAAFCVAIGDFAGIVNGTPAKRAQRSRPRSAHSRFSGSGIRRLISVTWKVAPSSIACPFTVRRWRTASV